MDIIPKSNLTLLENSKSSGKTKLILKLFFGKDVYNFIIYSRITLHNPGRDYEK